MAVETTYPHIEKPADDTARLARLPRIRVAQIVADYLARGWSPDEMCRQYPHLTQAEVHAAMAYYYDHQEEITRELQEESEEAERARANAPDSPFVARMRAKGLM